MVRRFGTIIAAVSTLIFSVGLLSIVPAAAESAQARSEQCANTPNGRICAEFLALGDVAVTYYKTAGGAVDVKIGFRDDDGVRETGFERVHAGEHVRGTWPQDPFINCVTAFVLQRGSTTPTEKVACQ